MTSIHADDVWSDDFGDTLEEDLGLGGTLRIGMASPIASPRGGSRPTSDLGGTCKPISGLGGTSSSCCNVGADQSSPIHGRSLRWVHGETIGRGSMGTVFQAMDPASGQVFAVKEVSFSNGNASDLSFRTQLETELCICQEVRHPRIVSYLGHDYLDDCLFIYMELMHGGSMAHVLKQFGAFEESLVAVYTLMLLEGLQHLHSREPPVLHRDIKGANVLVGIDQSVKLSDFGCSKRTMETMAHTLKGSLPWMAPEVISNTGYGRRADIWSLGCVLIEMATAQSPWGKFDNPMQAMMKIGMGKELPPMPKGLSEECTDFIRKCAQRDKHKRPFADQLLQHAFVRDLLLEDRRDRFESVATAF